MEENTVVDVRRARLRLPSAERREEIRRVAGVSREAMAEDLGVSSAAIHLWERGGTPSRRNVVAYVRLLEALESVGE